MELIVLILIGIIPFLLWHLEKWCKRSGERGKIKRKGEVYIRYGNSQDKKRLKKFEIFEKACKIFRYIVFIISIIGCIYCSNKQLLAIGCSLFMTSAITILGLDSFYGYESKKVKMFLAIILYTFLHAWLWLSYIVS